MGISETAIGLLAEGGGTALTLSTGGLSSEVTVPVAAGGAVLAVHGAAVTTYATLNLAKSSGRNEPHANQDRKNVAQEKYEKAKAEYEKAKSQPNKTKEDKAALEKLKKEVDHQKRKADYKGDNDSQKAKGSN